MCSNPGTSTRQIGVCFEFNRRPSTIIASTFGLITGLIRHKGIPAHSLINSPRFLSIVGLLNSVALDLGSDLDPDRAKDISFGGKIHQAQRISVPCSPKEQRR